MATRILSGLIRPLTVNGTVQIDFNPHQLVPVVSPQAEMFNMRTVGPAGDFTRRPAAIVAVRQFKVLGIAGRTDVHLIINDRVLRARMTITWRSGGDIPVLIEEISYMVIGEVP